MERIDYSAYQRTALIFMTGLFTLAASFGCGTNENKTSGNNREADSLLQIKQAMKKLEDIQKILNRDSTDFEAWRQKGELLAFLQDTAGAIQALEISFFNYPLATNGLALANLYAETKNEKAVTLCNWLLANDTVQEFADPYYIKGNYYSRINNIPAAIQQYDSCILRDWKFTDAYLDKGILLFKQNEFSNALETFQLAATVSNTNPDTYFWIGRCLEVKGEKNQALKNYRNAFALDPSFAEARERAEHLEKDR